MRMTDANSVGELCGHLGRQDWEWGQKAALEIADTCLKIK